MLAKIGSFIYRRRVIILCVTLILAIGVAIYGLGVFPLLNASTSVVDNSESTRATQLLQEKFSNTSTDVILLLRSKTFKVTDAAFAEAATTLLSRLSRRPEVASLTSYYGTRSTAFLSKVILLPVESQMRNSDLQASPLAPSSLASPPSEPGSTNGTRQFKTLKNYYTPDLPFLR